MTLGFRGIIVPLTMFKSSKKGGVKMEIGAAMVRLRIARKEAKEREEQKLKAQKKEGKADDENRS